MTSPISSVQTTSLVSHLYTEHALLQLRQAFPEKVICPKSTMETIMYEAGRQSVIKHVEQQIRSNRLHGK